MQMQSLREINNVNKEKDSRVHIGHIASQGGYIMVHNGHMERTI
jgi:hypothetical protein